MRKLKSVSYEEVSTFFNKVHPVDETSIHFAGNKWAMKHLEWADEVAVGTWSLCELEASEVLAIVCAHHAAEGTDTVLVPETGRTLQDLVADLQRRTGEYAENNPECWAKMAYWEGKDFSPVLLSTEPTMEGKGRRSLVDPSLGSLFHQDGLHRLVRWALDGRFEAEIYAKNPQVTAYIAGEITI